LGALSILWLIALTFVFWIQQQLCKQQEPTPTIHIHTLSLLF
jgi:hypothetical protein